MIVGDNGRLLTSTDTMTWTPRTSGTAVGFTALSKAEGVVDGVAPPIAPRVQFNSGQIVRDQLGNAIGGIALSEHAVPTAYNGTGNSGGTFCNLFGVHEPFTADQLRSLYRNQGAYVSAVAKANTANRKAGFLLDADSAESTSNAVSAKILER